MRYYSNPSYKRGFKEALDALENYILLLEDQGPRVDIDHTLNLIKNKIQDTRNYD